MGCRLWGIGIGTREVGLEFRLHRVSGFTVSGLGPQKVSRDKQPDTWQMQVASGSGLQRQRETSEMGG